MRERIDSDMERMRESFENPVPNVTSVGMGQVYSTCCGYPPQTNGDSSTEDYGICPACGEFTEYEE